MAKTCTVRLYLNNQLIDSIQGGGKNARHSAMVIATKIEFSVRAALRIAGVQTAIFKMDVDNEPSIINEWLAGDGSFGIFKAAK